MTPTLLLSRTQEGTTPGDILAAIDNETRIDAASIGEITVHPQYALLDAPADLADDLAHALDTVQINNTRVTAHTLTGKEAEALTEIEEYVDRYTDLVDLEREEEMRQHEQEIKTLSGEERQAKGRALLQLQGKDKGGSLAGYNVQFTRQDKKPLPETEITVGDLAMISKNDPLRDDNPTGTVTRKTNYAVTVAFPEKPRGFVFSQSLRLDLYVNDITYQRMKTALHTLPTLTDTQKQLRDIVTNQTSPTAENPVDIDTWYNPGLNESQKEAVKKAVATDDIHLIHGPPGTGKTTTCIEVIEQAVSRGETVLATAASNTAADNVLEYVLAQGVDAVRVGNPARVTETLREHTLDNQVQQKEQYREAQQLREQAFQRKEKQENLTYPSGKYRRGMSNQKIKTLAEKGEGARGVDPDTVREMAEWLEHQEEINTLFEKADRLKDEAVEHVLDEVDVVCTTNSTAGSDLLQHRGFDLLVLDEATQATTPSCLIPIVKADRVVMAGDHKQLPPTVKSYEAEQHGLGHTLFECLAEEHPETVSTLTTQYRMHEDIMQFSNTVFYDNTLTADTTVKTHTVKDLGFDTANVPEQVQPVLAPEPPIAFVDTADSDAAERSPSDSPSKENRVEAAYTATLVEACIAAGIPHTGIAVITPYDAQVDRIQQNIDHHGVEIDTVDGFQGREKEVVIISLVRSNPDNTIGFLRDVRRLNVALTRAKRKLVVVGDGDTVTTHPVYKSFINYVQQRGTYHRLS